MANKIENKNGFLIIETTAEETWRWGGIEICDCCGQKADKGYLIAVLNSWYCWDCYDEWLNDAIVYPSDRSIEKRIYNRYARNFDLDTV